MKRRLLWMPGLAIMLIVAACATTPPYNPFKISKEDLYAKIKTIAILSVVVPGDLPNPPAIRAKFDPLIEAKLREAGFSVVPSRETEEVFERMTKQLGGIFDPVTGERDETKAKALRDHARKELSAKFKVDAVFFARIRPISAGFQGGSATWNGTSESIAMTGGFLDIMAANNKRGTTTALSLLVGIERIEGGDAYLNMGGIQLLNKLSRGGFARVPGNQLFVDDKRNAEAVAIALGPLMKEPPPDEAPKNQ